MCKKCRPFCKTCNDGFTCSSFIIDNEYSAVSVLDNDRLTVAFCPSSCYYCER